jgi:hypothetical protein
MVCDRVETLRDEDEDEGGREGKKTRFLFEMQKVTHGAALCRYLEQQSSSDFNDQCVVLNATNWLELAARALSFVTSFPFLLRLPWPGLSLSFSPIRQSDHFQTATERGEQGGNLTRKSTSFLLRKFE